MKKRLVFIVAVAGLLLTEHPCFCQFEALKNVFGGKATPNTMQPFSGGHALNQALAAAESGDVTKSLKLVSEAFQQGGIGDSLEHPQVKVLSANLLSLSRAWEANGADPTDVASALLDIVLPTKMPGEVKPYLGQWSLSNDMLFLSRSNQRLPVPESVGAELVRWAILAKQNDQFKKRLQTALDMDPQDRGDNEDKPPEKGAESRTGLQARPNSLKNPAATQAATQAATKLNAVMARVLAVQFAMAENDIESANRILKQLNNNAKQLNGTILEYLLHAVSAALPDTKSTESALGLMEVVLDRMEQVLPAQSAIRMNSPWLRVHAGSIHARDGRREDARRFAMASVAKPINGSQFGADYAAYLDHLLQQRAAVVLLDTGHIIEGIEFASAKLNGSAARYSGREAGANLAARVGREIKKLAPADRFELLRKFMLRNGDVQSVVDLVPNDSPPRLGSGLMQDVYSTSWELVSTARELGKLDDLIRELSSISPPTPAVQSLLMLAMVMRDGSTNTSNGSTLNPSSANETFTRLNTLLDATTAAVPPWELKVKPEPPLETYVIASEAALHPEWQRVAEQLMLQLIEHAQRTQSARIRDHFRLALMEVKRLRFKGGPATATLTGALNQQRADGATSPIPIDWLKLRPQMWDMLGFESASERSFGAMPPTWFTYENYLSHLSTGQQSTLCFAIPLTGTFELSGECREGGWTEGRIGYGGVASEVFAYTNSVHLRGNGQTGVENSPKMTNLLHSEPWNRHTIRCDGEVVRYYVNGQLVFEDTPGMSAPWLTLGGSVGFTPSYRNLRISGSPTIPREVQLLGDTRLRGWIATYFNESRPETLRKRRYIQVTLERNGQQFTSAVEDDGTMEGTPIEINQGPTDWAFTDGELRSSRRSGYWAEESPSWLSYQRPLRENELVRYEFFHAPGKTIAHPTFGDVVYSLTKMPAENLANRNSSASIDGRLATTATKDGPLKDGWNSAVISLRAGTLTIALNGQEIVSNKVLPTNSRRIGFYHDAATSDLRVRNVELTGNWPKLFDAAIRYSVEFPVPIEALPNMEFLAQSPSLNEALLSDNAYEISRSALKLETAERYQFLHRWVMPNESHGVLRMAGAFTPTHPAPPVLNENPIDAATAEGRHATDQRMVQTGGNFVCPAILLVLAASELDRLAELKQEVTGLDPAISMGLAQNRAAMLGIIALIQDAPAEAIARISESLTLLMQRVDIPFHERWGNASLASLAIQHPNTRRIAFELLDKMESLQIHPGHAGMLEFERFVRQLQGQCLYLMYGGVPEEFGSQPKTTQWRAVAIPRARSRGTGYPIASFDTIAGEVAERGGHDFDAAYFQSPLRGNYEVRCRISHLNQREALLMGAGIANALKWNHKEVKVTHIGQPTLELPLAKPIVPEVHEWLGYKIVVKDGHYTSYVNGQKLYEETLPAGSDPWLAVAGWAGNSSRAVREIVISGQPKIPNELELLESPELQGWMADYYAAERGQKPFPWMLADGELKSDQSFEYFSGRSRLKVENIIRYHRPMLEDGEITYEFFYENNLKREAPPSDRLRNLGTNQPKRTVPGMTIVHPALDRMVCLLEPGGVKIHWLTDGRWDRTGLTADNIDETGNRDDKGAQKPKPLLLKSGEWNAIKFAIKGDALTIELNGEQIFAREIEPTNLRQFGLFHNVNESNVRVRNIRYRGDWPKTLPCVSEQELAGGPQKLAEIQDADLPDAISWDFTKSKFNLSEFQYHWNSDASKQIRPSDAGLRFVQPAGETKPPESGIAPKIRISGDFVATIEYAGLKTVASEVEWGSGLSFKVHTDGEYNTGFEVRHAHKSIWKSIRMIVGVHLPNCPWGFRSEAVAEFPIAARLRLQRRGSVFYTLIADPGSDQFRLLTQLPLGTDDIRKLVISSDACDQAAGAEFTLKSLSIRAAKITNVK